uniref:Superoxide dismutase n=1 Tax=Amblyomma aureolatum TaxID=187763 RepID=A0A1E1X9A2_9ACAR
MLGACSRNLVFRSLATLGARKKHTLPDLPYDYNALEPIISADLMHVHHDKHHAAYVNNLNAAEEKLADALAKNCTQGIVSASVAVKFNGGGHLNHSIYWTNLSPNGGGEPTGDLLDAIKKDFGSFEVLKGLMSARAVGVQGSGWAWLGYNPKTQRLQVASTFNQDALVDTEGLVPLFTIDVWEHAYYLQYRNVRPDYVKAIWDIANWDNVAERLQKARSQ